VYELKVFGKWKIAGEKCAHVFKSKKLEPWFYVLPKLRTRLVVDMRPNHGSNEGKSRAYMEHFAYIPIEFRRYETYVKRFMTHKDEMNGGKTQTARLLLKVY
jgi:hypothetical protein